MGYNQNYGGATGICIASSSTQATKTLSATSDIFFTARTVA